MRPILFHIGRFPIHSYGVLLVIGFLICIWCTMRVCERRMKTEPEGSPRRISPDFIFDIGVGGLLVGGAFALALGGAMGNLLDRLRYGYVVDFFDVRVIHWPIFNIADTAISCGILLLLWHFFRSGSAEQENDASRFISSR